MKPKVKILSLLVLLVILFSTTIVYASTVEQIVEPQGIIYCPATTSGYHEGVESGGLCQFWNEDLYPGTKVYFPAQFTLNTCRGCGAQIYVSYQGYYFDAYLVHVKDGYYCVDPDYIPSYTSSIPGWTLGYANYSIKEDK